jgi:hypothetical protein
MTGLKNTWTSGGSFTALRQKVPAGPDVMSPTVWISTTNPEVTFDSEDLGDHWQRVGEIDTIAESQFWKSAKGGSSIEGHRVLPPR